MDIAIDIDNTLAFTAESLINALVKLKHIPEDACYSDLTTWRVGDIYDVEPKIVSDILCHPVFVRNLFADKSAVEAMKLFPGCRYLVTARPETSRMDTLYWLRKNSVSYNNLYFTTNLSAKIDFLKQGKFDIIIDDVVEVQEAFADNPKVEVFLVSKPWNTRGKNRFSNWHDLASKLRGF